MSDDIARLQLIRSDNIGPVTYRQLIRRFGSAGAALAALPDLVRHGGGSARVATAADAERELAGIAAFGAQVVFVDGPDYPLLLARTETAPPALVSRATLGCSSARARRWSGRATRAPPPCGSRAS